MSRCLVTMARSGGHCPLRVSGGGVYYALRGGNHVMHFRQSHWKKLVRGAIIAKRSLAQWRTGSLALEINKNARGFPYGARVFK